MSPSKKGSQITLTKQSPKNKGPSLNPNAAEFVPFSLKPSIGMASNPDLKGKLPASGSQGKQVVDQTESYISTNSDEEAHQYWQQHLPDDITPDFKVMGGEDPDGVLSLSLGGLSLLDGSESSTYSPTSGGPCMLNEHMEFAGHANHVVCSDQMGYPPSSVSGDTSSSSFRNWQAKSWTKPVVVGDPFVGSRGEGTSLEEDNIHGYAKNMLVADNFVIEKNKMNPLNYLTLKFPGFAAESLAEVYFANDCDLQMTIEILTQLELQVDVEFNQGINSKTSSAPNLSSSDFPSLLASHNKSGLPKYVRDEVTQTTTPYIPDKDHHSLKPTSSFLPKGAVDFASAVRKIASQESGVWKYDGNVLADSSLGSSRSPKVLDRSNNTGPVHDSFGDKFQSRGSSHAIPAWLETGAAVEKLYSELRGEARDHARVRNVYFEQARQAFLIGNKALAKDLSAKGHLYNEHMKAAHVKAQESIYRQRNPLTPEVRGSSRGNERLIDLHGLHVREAIHILKNELRGLRSAARSAEQRLQVYICVGTGHHTKGSRTPARLPVAIQRYLLEEEGLQYSEPQPGLLRVVIY